MALADTIGMNPGGHLATAVALAASGYATTGSVELAAGCVAGAFLIDADHYVDYLTVEGEWRRPGPLTFLRYAFGHRSRRFVLLLHSFELLGGLALLAVRWPRPALVGYVVGAVLHLALDVLVNGPVALRRPLLFYCFAYRAAHGFARDRLVVPLWIPPDAGRRPLREFFSWRPRGRRILEAPSGTRGEGPPGEIATA